LILQINEYSRLKVKKISDLMNKFIKEENDDINKVLGIYIDLSTKLQLIGE